MIRFLGETNQASVLNLIETHLKAGHAIMRRQKKGEKNPTQ